MSKRKLILIVVVVDLDYLCNNINDVVLQEIWPRYSQVMFDRYVPICSVSTQERCGVHVAPGEVKNAVN